MMRGTPLPSLPTKRAGRCPDDADWTVAETLTWIAFGDAVTFDQMRANGKALVEKWKTWNWQALLICARDKLARPPGRLEGDGSEALRRLRLLEGKAFRNRPMAEGEKRRLVTDYQHARLVLADILRERKRGGDKCRLADLASELEELRRAELLEEAAHHALRESLKAEHLVAYGFEADVEEDPHGFARVYAARACTVLSLHFRNPVRLYPDGRIYPDPDEVKNDTDMNISSSLPP